MPTCQGCGFTYQDILQKCPYCGRSNSNLSSGTASGFECPKCHSVGQKLTSIQDTGVTTIEGTVPVRHDYVDNKGRVRGYTVQQKTVQTQKSGLAQLFAPPPKPALIGGSGCLLFIGRLIVWSTMTSTALFFLAMSQSLFTSIKQDLQSDTLSMIISIFLYGFIEVLFLAVCGGIIFGLLRLHQYLARKAKEASEKATAENEARQKAWLVRAERWKEAFYCANCETLYIPGETWFQPKQAYSAFLDGPKGEG